MGLNDVKDKFGNWIDGKYREGKPTDYFKNLFEIANDYGFDNECHTVQTQDGYELNMFRIKDPRTPDNAPVIFLQHGIFGTAENWTSNSDLSPAFLLAKAGYDVWLGNSRGSKYSRSHLEFDPNTDGEFWDFSWQ